MKFELRSVFIWTLYLAVGLAVGTRIYGRPVTLEAVRIDRFFIDWHDTFLVVASLAIAVGLIKQTRAICRWGRTALDGPSWFGVRLEASWRMAVAAGLFFEVALQLSISRGFFNPPKSDFVHFPTSLTTFAWWVLLTLPLIEAALRGNQVPKPSPVRKTLDAVACGALMFIPIYLGVYNGFTLFFSHVVLREIDASLAHTGNRHCILTAELEWRIVAAAVGAALAAFAGAGLMISAFGRRRQPALRLALCATGLALLMAAGGYCLWYYQDALPQLSPDLAAGGWAPSWFDILGGVVLALTIVTAATVRVMRRASLHDGPSVQAIEVGPAVESLPVLWCLAGTSGLMLVLTIIGCLNDDSIPPSEMFEYALFYPNTTFSGAFFVLSVYLLWRRRLRAVPPTLQVALIRPRQFIAAWLAMAVTLAVTVPTLAALSFSYRLGPWYRW